MPFDHVDALYDNPSRFWKDAIDLASLRPILAS
jgi:hypothetical protein